MVLELKPAAAPARSIGLANMAAEPRPRAGVGYRAGPLRCGASHVVYRISETEDLIFLDAFFHRVQEEGEAQGDHTRRITSEPAEKTAGTQLMN
jgi:hypothetical protein